MDRPSISASAARIADISGRQRFPRCRALGVGLLSGGYGDEELRQSGAIRVYDDPADLLDHLDEVGGRR